MSDRTIQGEMISPGRVVGNLCFLPPGVTGAAELSNRASAAPTEEAERFQQGAQNLVEEMRQMVSRLEEQSMSAEADIVRAHVTMLKDPEFHRQVHERIEQARFAAERAVDLVLSEMADLLATSEDETMAQRAADFRDMAGRLKARLAGDEGDLGNCLQRVDSPILAAEELLASTVLQARDAGVRGFVVAQGTGLSHGAILAKSFGLPALRIGGLDPLHPAGGQPVLLDADAGRIVIRPGAAALETAYEEAKEETASEWPLPCRLWLSVVDPAQLDGIDWSGVEGIGLYRTEVLFMHHSYDFPGEEEQFQSYRRLFEAAGNRPVVIRTADLGADKPVAHMTFGPQQNPYLGLRAHRIFRFHPEIFVTQVRAVLRAAAGGHRLHLMFPMLETVDQWRMLRRLVDQAVAGLDGDGIDYQGDFELGVLVETPSAAWSFGELLGVIDFACIGTNDLVQYFFAVERDTANVADLYQPEHPVMLRLLKHLAGQASEAGKSVSVCGEIAADVRLVPVLVGLGIEDLSVAPSQVPAVRRALADQQLDDCRSLADACLAADGVDGVRRKLGMPARTATPRPEESLPEGYAGDPVCGMTVHIDDAQFSVERDGRRYYFCSDMCRGKFEAKPERYLRRREPS